MWTIVVVRPIVVVVVLLLLLFLLLLLLLLLLVLLVLIIDNACTYGNDDGRARTRTSGPINIVVLRGLECANQIQFHVWTRTRARDG